MARVIRRFPNKVEEVENVWIPMPDGTRLAARIWLPDDAQTRPVPAILEFIPYRKRDFTATGDALHHPYMAGHGYAAVRCDVRGNGDSEGLFDDEYSAQELDDGYHVVEWLAAQPWCTGRVGMMGISWGGFNCLQVAAKRPPSLKAIYSVCSTDDRYSDDVHFQGGCLLNDNLTWGSTMTTFAMRPPDPAIVGERWRDMWMARLENMPNLVANWMKHQTRDEFWKHGSVCEDYADIEAATYMVGGWADGYTNTVLRTIEHLKAPSRALIGPWTHAYPWKATPGPAINGLRDLIRWWDHWLKDKDTGMLDEPKIRVWMQHSVPPATSYDHRDGYWVAESAWPSSHVEPSRFHLNASGFLQKKPRAERKMAFCSEQVTGVTHGDWCPYGYEAEMPSDQREEDGRSLSFDSAPLTRALPVLGTPVLNLELTSNRPQALVYVRLCDVAPDGASTRVSYATLNLTHRQGHEEPQDLIPGERYQVRVRLNDIGHRFAKGHRIRIAIASVGWPVVWTSPQAVTLELVTGASHLDLPVRPRRPSDRALASLGKPETAAPIAVTQTTPYRRARGLRRDYVSGETIVDMVKDRGDYLINDVGLHISGRGEDSFGVTDGNPLSAWAHAAYRITVRRDGEFDTRVETKFHLSSTREDFILSTDADAYEGERRVFARRWSEKIPRNGV